MKIGYLPLLKIRKQNSEREGQTKANVSHYPKSNCFSAIKARELKNMAHRGCLDPARGSLNHHFSKNIHLAFGNMQKYLNVSLPWGNLFRANVTNALTQPNSRLVPKSKPLLNENSGQNQQVRAPRRQANHHQPTSSASWCGEGWRVWAVHHQA